MKRSLRSAESAPVGECPFAGAFASATLFRGSLVSDMGDRTFHNLRRGGPTVPVPRDRCGRWPDRKAYQLALWLQLRAGSTTAPRVISEPFYSSSGGHTGTSGRVDRVYDSGQLSDPTRGNIRMRPLCRCLFGLSLTVLTLPGCGARKSPQT